MVPLIDFGIFLYDFAAQPCSQHMVSKILSKLSHCSFHLGQTGRVG